MPWEWQHYMYFWNFSIRNSSQTWSSLSLLSHRICTAQEYAWKHIISRWNRKGISNPLAGVNPWRDCPATLGAWCGLSSTGQATLLGWKGSCFGFLVTIPEKLWMQGAEKVSIQRTQVTFNKGTSQLNKCTLKPLCIISIRESKWRSCLKTAD